MGQHDTSAFRQPKFSKPRTLNHKQESVVAPFGAASETAAAPILRQKHSQMQACTLQQGYAQDILVKPVAKQARTGQGASKQATKQNINCYACADDDTDDVQTMRYLIFFLVVIQQMLQQHQHRY